MKILNLLPDTTGFMALYENRADSERSPIFVPLVGWAVLDTGEVTAVVPTDDGGVVPARDYAGQDGELKFELLVCEHDLDTHHDCSDEHECGE